MKTERCKQLQIPVQEIPSKYIDTESAFFDFCEDNGVFENEPEYKVDTLHNGSVLVMYLKYSNASDFITKAELKGYEVLKITGRNKLLQCNIGMRYDVFIVMISKESVHNDKEKKERERKTRITYLKHTPPIDEKYNSAWDRYIKGF